MPITLAFDTARGILLAEANGSPDINAFREAMEQIASGVDYPSTVPTIWDLRGLDFASYETEVAKEISSIREKFPKRGKARIAYVVPDMLGYGMIRILQSRTDTTADSLVCYEYEEAVRWLLGGVQNAGTLPG